MYEKALKLVEEQFKNKVDKAGMPYMGHLLEVSNQGLGEYEKTLGLLHDIIEDTSVTAEDLLNMGFPIDLVTRLNLLTHNKEVPYQNYIDAIIESGDIVVLHIKKYDLQSNLNPNRLSILPEEKQAHFQKKYISVLDRINQKIFELEQAEFKRKRIWKEGV